MADASSRASLLLEIVDLEAYRAGAEAARKATQALTDAQAAVIPMQVAAVKAAKEKAAADKEAAATAKQLADVEKMVEKAYVAALPPAEKTARVIQQLSAIQTDNLGLQIQIGAAIAANTKKYEDQFRRQEMNRGSQHGLSRSLAELLDEQTKAQTAAIAAGAAMLKEGLSSQKLSLAIEHLRDTTGEADKKTEAYREEIAKLEGQLRDVTAAEKANAAAQVAAAEHYDLTKKKLDAVETAMEGLRIPGAEIVTSMKRMSDAMETANRTLTPMQVNMLKGAVAVGAVGAAGAAAVAGVVALGAAIIANSAAADEYNEELRQFNLNLDATGTMAVNRAAAGLDAVGVAGKMMSVTLAESVAPAIEEGSTRVVAMGFAAVDAWKNFASGKDTLTIIAELVAKGLVGAFNALISPLKNAAIGLALLSDAVGVTDDAAINIRNTFDQFTKSLEASTADGLAYMVKEGLKPLIAATDDYMGRAGELVTKQEAINRATRDGAAAATEAAEAWELYRLKAVGANEEILKSTEKTAEGTAALSDYAARNQKQDVKEVRDATIAALEQEGAMRAQQVAFGLSVATQAADATIALVQMVAGESSKAALAAFLIQKAAALASIGVATAENISKAAALFAFPSPPGIAAVAAAAALGALQAGVVVGSAIGQFNSANAPAAGGTSAGGGAPASSGGGGGPALPGGGFMSASASAPGLLGNAAEPRPLSIPSSDGYFPPSMGGRTIQTAPGDEAWVQRSGALNRANQSGDTMAGLERRLDALLTEFKGLRQDSRMRLHFAAATGPARGQ